MSIIKYHYEVVKNGDPKTTKRLDCYDHAESYAGDTTIKGEDTFTITKWRTVVNPNYIDLPTASTYEEAKQVIKNGGSLWHEHIDCDEDDPDCGEGCCIGTEDLETLALETDNGEDFERGHYHIYDGMKSVSLRLGECVDGDLGAPCNCSVCDEELWKGDTIYIDAQGYVDDEGYPEANQDESYGAICPDCQSRIADSVIEIHKRLYDEAEKRRNG